MPDEAAPSRRGFLAGAAALGGAAGTSAAADPAKPGAAVNPRLFTFVGGKTGTWTVTGMTTIAGDGLPAAEKLEVVAGAVAPPPAGAAWVLRGVTSNERYATRPEKAQLVAKQAALGRPAATHAAIIPIRKNAKWWALTQDERRAIFEDASKHVTVGMKYLPAVARRLHHCRDLGEAEPFDFVTQFDYTKADIAAFDDMLAEMRASEEWKYIDREVDIRMVRDS